jgi:hypothetical protein
MASHIATSYRPQAIQVNEKSAPESSLHVTLTQHPRDEDPQLREVCVCLEIDSFRNWYYSISPNFHTLLLLLQVDPTSSDEPKIVYECCYKIEDTSILAWSSIPSIGHYH